MVFELLDARDVNGVAAYAGFPVRYPSWRFGMDYEKLEKGRHWGLSKIYELVINNDPTYAYLVRSNSLLEQKLVMAHVYGHADFFKNNLWFSKTNKNMIAEAEFHEKRLHELESKHGKKTIEEFLDICISLQWHTDFFGQFGKGEKEELILKRPKKLDLKDLRGHLDLLKGHLDLRGHKDLRDHLDQEMVILLMLLMVHQWM